MAGSAGSALLVLLFSYSLETSDGEEAKCKQRARWASQILFFHLVSGNQSQRRPEPRVDPPCGPPWGHLAVQHNRLRTTA